MALVELLVLDELIELDDIEEEEDEDEEIDEEVEVLNEETRRRSHSGIFSAALEDNRFVTCVAKSLAAKSKAVV